MKANPTIGLWRTLALVLTLALLAACGKGGGGSASAPARVENPTTPFIGTAQIIQDIARLHAGFQRIAMNASGVAVAVWAEFNPTDPTCLITCFAIHSNRYNGGWDGAVLIQTNSGVNTDFSVIPQVAIDLAGNAIAVWQQSRTTVDVRGNRYDIGPPVAAWGMDEPIPNPPHSGAFFPQVVMDNFGNGIAVWAQDDNPDLLVLDFNVWSRRYTVAAGWGAAPSLISDAVGSSDPVGTQIIPQIAINASTGDAIVVWQANGNIWARSYTGVWNAAVQIDDLAGSATNPQIAMNSNGDAIAVWQQFDGTSTNIYARRYTTPGGWVALPTVAIDNQLGNAGDAANPQITINLNGDAVAVWQQFDGALKSVYANAFAFVGTSWGTAGLVETDNAGNATEPQVAIDADGVAVAVWQQYDTTRFNLWTSTRTAGVSGVWNPRSLLEQGEGGAGFAQVVVHPAGSFAIAVWEQEVVAGGDRNVWANRFFYK